MKNSIRVELESHILDRINEGVIDNTNRDEWHFHCFNEDYYIIYHSVAVEWLKNHNLDTFEAIDIVKEYEEGNFGSMTTDINPESIVNMLAYIYGEEIIYSIDADTVEELKEELS
jgi:radical SAM superfamily enzyme